MTAVRRTMIIIKYQILNERVTLHTTLKGRHAPHVHFGANLEAMYDL